jgi:GNAT superfamily N-acetyltransferase
VSAQARLAPVAEHDFEALVALRIESMRPSLERLGRFDPLRARERLRDGFSPPHAWHVELAGERVGFFVLKPREDGLHLEHLYLRPAAQGRGLGAAVLAHVFAQADALAAPVHVGALRGSDSNRFYLRHGFRLVAEEALDNRYVRLPG